MITVWEEIVELGARVGGGRAAACSILVAYLGLFEKHERGSMFTSPPEVH
jgi:hypothetical protein